MPRLQDFSFPMRSARLRSDARIADTSEKAFTPIPSDEVWLSMAGRFSKSLYSAIQPGVRVRARKTACDSFICKHTVDVIRIYPLIPFHLLFTSRAAPQRESRCPSASPARVPSVDPSTRIRPFPLSLSLSHLTFSRIREEQRFPIPTIARRLYLAGGSAWRVPPRSSRYCDLDPMSIGRHAFLGISRPYR